jgi:hypothetical protein
MLSRCNNLSSADRKVTEQNVRSEADPAPALRSWFSELDGERSFALVCPATSTAMSPPQLVTSLGALYQSS